MADTITTSKRKSRDSVLNAPMAALAGGSVGFFTFAMPADLFERLIGATGLPSLVPAAQPPLGDTARIAFVAAAAIATLLLTWLLLRALDKAPRATPRSFATDVTEDAPRLRRADMHPDAPSRRPIRAGSDLGIPLDSAPCERGEPVDLVEAENVDFEAEWERPAPNFLKSDNDVGAQQDEMSVEGEPDAAEPYELTQQAEPANVRFWLPEGAEEATVAESPSEIEPEQPHALQGDGTILPFWAQQVANEPVDPEPQGSEPSLDQLSNRLEGGLVRRKREGRSTRPRGHRGVDDRLRGALDDLGKVTGRR